MKALIKLNVPEWQIGQDVNVYFPDTMMQKSVCEADNTDSIKIDTLKEARAIIEDSLNNANGLPECIENPPSYTCYYNCAHYACLVINSMIESLGGDDD